ncbi:MAG TPA: hypothetical protein VGL37_09430 [Solirubrobacteraceae bacterium]
MLALGATAIVLAVLLWELSLPRVRALLASVVETRRSRRARAGEHAGHAQRMGYDPGRERRAEQRARALLRSCVNDEEWSMYRDLGFLRIAGRAPQGTPAAPYAYLIYPHRPIVAYLTDSGALLSEYCVAFPDHSRPYGSTRLPDADDVLAKWMALAADERRLIADANMHLPGRQLDPEQVRDDLVRLARWEHERLAADRDRVAAEGERVAAADERSAARRERLARAASARHAQTDGAWIARPARGAGSVPAQ